MGTAFGGLAGSAADHADEAKMYSGAVLQIGPKMMDAIKAKNRKVAKRKALEVLANFYAYEVVRDYAPRLSREQSALIYQYRQQAAHILIGLTRYEKEHGYVPGEDGTD